MSDLSDTTYFQLVSQFLLLLAPTATTDAIDPENGVLEFTAGNLVLRLMPHANKGTEDSSATKQQSVIIEADLMLLDLENRAMNHDRFLILHQLNHLSQWTTGIVASISERGMLSIAKRIPLANLTPDSLASEVTNVMQAGNHLYKGWNELAELNRTQS